MSGRLPLPGGGTREGHAVRQTFQYLLLFGLVVVSGLGVCGLLDALLSQGTTLAASDDDIARSVAFTLVGVPLLAAIVVWTRRSFAADPAEARSIGWLFYLSAAGLVSLIVAVVALHATISWVIGLQDFDGTSVANAVVWSAIWAVHWRLVTRQRVPLLVQPYLLGGSLFGLVTGLVGLGILLTGAIEVCLGLTEEVIADGVGSRPLGAAVTLVLAGAVWTRHWLLSARGSQRNALWLAYLLLAGVAAGLIVSVTAGSIAAYRVAVWLVGDPWTDVASRYFDSMPATLATVVVGLLTLAYHQAVVASVVRDDRDEVDRVRDYLLAVIGLGAAAVGTTIVVVALVEAIANPDVLAGPGPVNTLLAALTLLAVGLPVWAHYWRRGQHAAGAGLDEVRSPTRRLYLFVLLGLATLVAVGALIAGAWVLVEQLLEGSGGLTVVRSIRYPIGLLATSAVVAGYHWSVYLRERERSAPEAPTGPRFVLLLGVGDAATATAVACRTGGQAWAWTRTDDDRVWPADDVLAAVTASSDTEVVVLADGDALRVVPVERRPPR